MKFTPRQRRRLELLKLRVQCRKLGLSYDEEVAKRDHLEAVMRDLWKQMKRELEESLFLPFDVRVRPLAIFAGSTRWPLEVRGANENTTDGNASRIDTNETEGE